jgi:Immune inhibitor A-like, MAM domain
MNGLRNKLFLWVVMFLLLIKTAYAETDVWSDNFETGAGSRWTTNSVWQIGSPAIGPATNSAGYRVHSGANCATVGLKSNYPYNADSRLICANYNGASFFVVPSANQYPRLRFWHWFNFVNALGYVEISTNGGDWQQISPTYLNATSSGVWSRPSIDLTPFAGQSVQFAFHFTSGGSCCGNAPGWYIDDVAVVTNTPVFNNPESFESSLGDWIVDYGTWETGVPVSGPKQAHGGTNCAATALAGNYGYNVESRLISPPFVVPSSSGQVLRFWHWYNLVNALGYVEIMTDNGSWSQISPNYLDSNTGGAWTNVSIDLSSYAGQTVELAFHFISGGACCGNAPGWYVDDISVAATPILTVPGTQMVYAGDTLIVTNNAIFYPSNMPTFRLVSAPTNVFLNATNGVLTWSPTAAQSPSTNTIYVKVTDNNVPPISVTNSFVVQVLWPPTLTIAGDTQLTNRSIHLGFNTILNATWRIDTSTNLLNWLPLLTNTASADGTIQFTDLLSTNYPRRFYRAVLQ